MQFNVDHIIVNTVESYRAKQHRFMNFLLPPLPRVYCAENPLWNLYTSLICPEYTVAIIIRIITAESALETLAN